MTFNVLITGGSGLVGKALLQTIPEKPDINATFLKSSDCDLRDTVQTDAYFARTKPDYVIHLAACVGGLFKNQRAQIQMFEDNLALNLNVVRACAKYKVKKMIACLSTCVFPDARYLVGRGYIEKEEHFYPLEARVIHDGPPHPSNAGYAYAKRMLGFHCSLYKKQGFDFCCVTPTNLFGPHDNFHLEDGHVLPSLIHQAYLAKKDGKSTFPVRGSGKPLRQFVYSLDFARLLWEMIQQEGGEANQIVAPHETLLKHPDPWEIDQARRHPKEVGFQEFSIRQLAEHIGAHFEVHPVFDRSSADGQHRKPAYQHLDTKVRFEKTLYALTATMKWFEANYETARK